MIESSYYKNDLLKYSDSFSRRKIKQSSRSDSLQKAEKYFFVGFYFVRKLIETIKITDSCKKISAEIIRYKINPEFEINNFSRYKAFDYIDEKNSITFKIDVKQICDKVIHSYLNLILCNDNNGLEGFLLTTDKYKNTDIWLIPVDSIIYIFQTFGNNYPRKYCTERNEDGKLVYWLCE